MFDSHDSFSTTSATFDVVVDGKILGRFIEASGLEVEVEVFEVKEGGENAFVHKFPGRFSYSNVTLKRGVTMDNGLMNWILASSGDGFEEKGKKLARTTVALVLTTSTGLPLRTWTFDEAFPVRWRGPNFTADSDDYLVEEIEIAHHGFSTKDGSPPKAVKAAATTAVRAVGR
jgi:phage tail-like protein